MGRGNYSDAAFKSVASTRSTMSTQQVFTQVETHTAMAPEAILVRESRDSPDHPQSNAVAVFFDHTGSMGKIPDFFAREGLGKLMRELLAKQPVPDPQLLVGAVGDGFTDRSPLQVGQYESSNVIDDWLTKIHIEGNGGGNGGESYGLAHVFAGLKTSIDCMEKRGRKGFLFTVGDEPPHQHIPKEQLERLGFTEPRYYTIEEAIQLASKLYHVFHVVVASQSYAPEYSLPRWKELLGERALRLDDFKALPELIVTTIALTSGMEFAAATKGFDAHSMALVRASGVQNLPAQAGSKGIVKL